MLGAATPALAVNVFAAGGLGFIASSTKGNALEEALQQAAIPLRASDCQTESPRK